MPDFLINGLSDLSVTRAIFLAVGLFATGAALLLLLVEVRHLTPRWLRRALPLWLRRRAVGLSLVSAHVRLVLVEWLLRHLTPSSPSAPKKGALR